MSHKKRKKLMDRVSTIPKDNHYQCKLFDCWIPKTEGCDYDPDSEACKECGREADHGNRVG